MIAVALAPAADRAAATAAAEALFDRLGALLATLAPPRPAVPQPAFGWRALCTRMPG